ncbi:hypothetical protein [Streptacidiphilus cavernicola]|uniref:SnoaL-like domain-containing protein n=1 Tax=Streptacidiphilus cavernicola TaxID=3342716 RepID=A0ABV6VQG1_9ACTN
MLPRPVPDIAADLREALHTADIPRLRDLFHPRVHWASTGPGELARHGRASALTWYRVRYDQGVRTRAQETLSLPAAIILALHITDPTTGDAQPDLYYRVFHLHGGQIAHIRDYTDRAHALEAATRTPLVTLPRTTDIQRTPAPVPSPDATR